MQKFPAAAAANNRNSANNNNNNGIHLATRRPDLVPGPGARRCGLCDAAGCRLRCAVCRAQTAEPIHQPAYLSARSRSSARLRPRAWPHYCRGLKGTAGRARKAADCRLFCNRSFSLPPRQTARAMSPLHVAGAQTLAARPLARHLARFLRAVCSALAATPARGEQADGWRKTAKDRVFIFAAAAAAAGRAKFEHATPTPLACTKLEHQAKPISWL